MKALLMCSLSVLLLCGCSRSPKSREIIILPDISASIDAQSRREMFAAIKEAALSLRRGDTLTVVPITGDADAELQGRILRYEIPSAANRKAYDSDLRSLATKIGADLDHLETNALDHPERHTDVLGTIRAATDEFSIAVTDKRLIILSDFLQDDRQFDFAKDRRLSNDVTAKKFAANLGMLPFYRSSVKVCLGRLRSIEYAGLQIERREAIDTFWRKLFASADISPDGPIKVFSCLGS